MPDHVDVLIRSEFASGELRPGTLALMTHRAVTEGAEGSHGHSCLKAQNNLCVLSLLHNIVFGSPVFFVPSTFMQSMTKCPAEGVSPAHKYKFRLSS